MARSAQVSNWLITSDTNTHLSLVRLVIIQRAVHEHVESVLYSTTGMLLISTVHHTYKTNASYTSVCLVMISVIVLGLLM